MKRRNVLQMLLAGAAMLVAKVRPAQAAPEALDPANGAVFRVIYVDPDCSGMECSGHLGKIVTHAQRCCENCTMTFGRIGYYRSGEPNEIGFGYRELQPLNAQAREIYRQTTAQNQYFLDRGRRRRS